MHLAQAYRDRPEPQVAVLEALADRPEEGMTVLELRAVVETDIDGIEAALGELKDDGLIVVEQAGEGASVTIRPADRVLAEQSPEPGESVFDRLRERLPF